MYVSIDSNIESSSSCPAKENQFLCVPGKLAKRSEK